MIEAFKASPLLLLFVVSAIGYGLGNIAIRGTKLGVAAVLFVGLAFGALDPAFEVPEIVILMGLSIFVYTIGLSSGPGFFQTFKKRGAKDTLFITLALGITAALTTTIHFWFGLNAATSAGLLSGSVTNTPSLAGLLDLISNTQPEVLREEMRNAAVIGYSLSYPMGVLGVMLAINLMRRWLKVDYRKEEEALQKDYPVSVVIGRKTVRVTNVEMTGKPLRELFQHYHRRIVFGRMQKGEEQLLPNMDTSVNLNDQLVLVGNEKILARAIRELGEPGEEELSYDRTEYDFRRIIISNPEIAGQSIASLNLSEQYSTIITRVQRGDIDLVATGETILELGDRILIIARREHFEAISKLFGNSFEAQSHINLLSFGLGMTLGLLLGMITFEFPGGFSFQLGYAGGPLLVALILGALRRTGPVVWTLPFSANLTLRQFGLILLLAGIGIRSGHTFLQTFLGGQGGLLLLAGAIITMIAAFLSLYIGYRWFRIPYSLLTGMISNQPAVLDFATERAGNKLPTIGFALMLPVGMIIKIILVQLLFVLL
ncbi:MAG: TrkA C-terminal domain-containing protein [Bacteroidota bacterium]